VQQDLQKQRILDLVRASLEFLDIPIDPNEFSLEEFGFSGGKPNVKMGWEGD